MYFNVLYAYFIFDRKNSIIMHILLLDLTYGRTMIQLPLSPTSYVSLVYRYLMWKYCDPGQFRVIHCQRSRCHSKAHELFRILFSLFIVQCTENSANRLEILLSSNAAFDMFVILVFRVIYIFFTWSQLKTFINTSQHCHILLHYPLFVWVVIICCEIR